jgi:chitin synthase
VSSKSVTPESFNLLVASAADDSKIIGICGETRLKNEEDSWWTMIQVCQFYRLHDLVSPHLPHAR